MTPDESPDPRSQIEGALASLAAKIRQEPTLPADPLKPQEPFAAALKEDCAVELPVKHCAFRHCMWSGGSSASLEAHVQSHHLADVDAVATLLPRCHPLQERRMSVYNEAIAIVVRAGAPLASYAIDRRCLFNYAHCMSDAPDAGLKELICFSCARRYPWIGRWGKRNEINWRPLLPCKARLFIMTLEQTQKILGMDSYLERYGCCDTEGPDLCRI